MITALPGWLHGAFRDHLWGPAVRTRAGASCQQSREFGGQCYDSDSLSGTGNRDFALDEYFTGLVPGKRGPQAVWDFPAVGTIYSDHCDFGRHVRPD